MADWSDYRPGHFDRTQLGKRDPGPGLFPKSEAQQLPGQAAMFGDADSPNTPDEPGESDCLEFQL